MTKRNLKIIAIILVIVIFVLTIFIPLRWYIGYGTYKSYRQEGWFTIRYYNGNLKCKILVENGKLLKIKDYYGIKNDIIDIGSFRDGNGYLKIYNRNGVLKEEGNVKDGLKDGMWIVQTESIIFRDTIYFYKGRSQYGTYTNWKDVFKNSYSY
jgi:antitoxin component YwqK of YwqJK toxin-antitoxin module